MVELGDERNPLIFLNHPQQQVFYSSLIHPSYIFDLFFIHPSFILHSSFIHPSFILHSSFIHPSFILHSSFIHPFYHSSSFFRSRINNLHTKLHQEVQVLCCAWDPDSSPLDPRHFNSKDPDPNRSADPMESMISNIPSKSLYKVNQSL